MEIDVFLGNTTSRLPRRLKDGKTDGTGTRDKTCNQMTPEYTKTTVPYTTGEPIINEMTFLVTKETRLKHGITEPTILGPSSKGQKE